jgi:hypothetical protein
MTYTAREVEEALEAVTYTVQGYYDKTQFHDVEFSWYGLEDTFYHFRENDDEEGMIPTSIGKVSLVELGGTTDYDSSGSLHAVIKVEDTGQLFRKDGWYQSHCGSEWDGEFREVQAVTKTVVVYE